MKCQKNIYIHFIKVDNKNNRGYIDLTEQGEAFANIISPIDRWRVVYKMC